MLVPTFCGASGGLWPPFAGAALWGVPVLNRRAGGVSSLRRPPGGPLAAPGAPPLGAAGGSPPPAGLGSVVRGPARRGWGLARFARWGPGVPALGLSGVGLPPPLGLPPGWPGPPRAPRRGPRVGPAYVGNTPPDRRVLVAGVLAASRVRLPFPSYRNEVLARLTAVMSTDFPVAAAAVSPRLYNAEIVNRLLTLVARYDTMRLL